MYSSLSISAATGIITDHQGHALTETQISIKIARKLINLTVQ